VIEAAGSAVGAGLLGFLVFLGLVGACIVLFRSFNTQLRKVRDQFPKETDRSTTPSAEDSGDHV
jgi:hypothetical protein